MYIKSLLVVAATSVIIFGCTPPVFVRNPEERTSEKLKNFSEKTPKSEFKDLALTYRDTILSKEKAEKKVKAKEGRISTLTTQVTDLRQTTKKLKVDIETLKSKVPQQERKYHGKSFKLGRYVNTTCST